MKPLSIIFTVLFCLCLTVFSAAQGKGKITGRIVDKSNNETLIGVPVMLEGTTLGSTTDLDGKYVIENVPAGNYNIIYRYIGYISKNIPNVKVNAGEIVEINIAMESSSQQLTEVTVTADMRRESIGSILLMQKKSATVQDGISSESIRRTPDKNTGEVIRRVSGASIQDGKFVVIRGLNDRYNGAMLNGVPLASTEPDRKAFSFDLFPSALLDNLIVTKTASPDLPGEFSGGLLQVNTKDIPETGFLSFSAGVSFNSQSTFQPYRTYAGGKKDWLGFDDGTRNLPGGFPTSEELKKMNQTQKINVSKTMKNDWAMQSNDRTPLAQSYQFSAGTNKKVFGRDLGIVTAINYNNTRRTVMVNREDFNFDQSKIYSYDDEQSRENVFWGGLLNLTYKLNDNSKISWKNLLSVNAQDNVIDRRGTFIENLEFRNANAFVYTSNNIANSILSGEHYMPSNKGRLKWYLSYTQTNQTTPDLRRMLYFRNLDPSSEDTTLQAFVPVGSASPNFAGKFYSDLKENNYSGEVNYSLPLNFLGENQTVKFGYFEQYKERDFTARVLGYVKTNPAFFNNQLIYKPIDSLFAPENMGTRGFRIDEITNPSDRYTAQANLHAGYVQFDNQIGKLRTVWGVRVENFIQKLDSRGYSNDVVRVDKNYVDILPSVNVAYSLTEKTNLRFAASKTVARPEFRELAPFGFYDFITETSLFGNDTLKRTSIYNTDIRYEYFPSSGQLISASVFHKFFQNPIEPFVDGLGAGTRNITPGNVTSGYVYGMETEIRKNFDFMNDLSSWKHWENLSVFGNVAIMMSRVDKSNDLRSAEDRPLQGQSPYVVNGGFAFYNPKNGFGINAVYNRVGRRIFQVGNDAYLHIWEAPRNLVDLQISKRIFEKAEVRFGIGDLLNNYAVFYQDQDKNGTYNESADTRIARIRTGINYSFSLSYRF